MKILYVSTLSNTINAFMLPHIELLLDQGHHVDVACNIDRDICPSLIERGCKVFEISFQRTPITKLNYIAYKNLRNLIKEQKYDIVHTHTPVASMCVRLACRNMEKVKVMYTAHGFHFFKGAPLKNWLVYFPVEYWLSRYTDVLITINKEDYTRAKKSFKPKSVKYIPGAGLDTKKYSQVVVDKLVKRTEIGIGEKDFLILSVGELNNNKNHETVIRAVAKLNNPKIHYVICGKGPLEGYLKNLATELGIGKKVKLLGFRRDIAEICKVADIFAFPSKREGLGLAALEAMSCGLPIITSNIHGIVDYSIDGVTGYSYTSTDVDGFSQGIKKLIEKPQMRSEISIKNPESVKKFDIKNVIKCLADIYQKV